jgi:hypothetical protein
MTRSGTDKQEIGGLTPLGAAVTRAKAYYRTSMATSSVKFRWLNKKGVFEAKNGGEIQQFLEFFGDGSASNWLSPAVGGGAVERLKGGGRPSNKLARVTWFNGYTFTCVSSVLLFFVECFFLSMAHEKIQLKTVAFLTKIFRTSKIRSPHST